MTTVTRGRQSDAGLKLSHDRKVSPVGWYQPSRRRWVPLLPNSFGLPPLLSCPGRTEWCTAVCYAIRAENGSGVAELLRHNHRLLLAAPTVEAKRILLAEMLDRFRATATARKIPPADLVFRIHWSGDFDSLDYAEAWGAAIRDNPDVRFWCYTRSFVPPVDVVPVLAGIPNLTLRLSVDEHNVEAAFAHARVWRSLHLDGCADDFATGRSLLAGRPSIPCPENAGRLPLMSDEGRGACLDCRACFDGRRDVLFASSHREHADEEREVVRARTPAPPPPPPPLLLHCARTGCHHFFVAWPAPGRAPIYCGKWCRWAAYHDRKRALATTG